MTEVMDEKHLDVHSCGLAEVQWSDEQGTNQSKLLKTREAHGIEGVETDPTPVKLSGSFMAIMPALATETEYFAVIVDAQTLTLHRCAECAHLCQWLHLAPAVY
jgi:hypothetical protein